MKNKAFGLTNTTESDYKKWCKRNHLNYTKESSRAKFFRLILDNKLIRDSNGELVDVVSKEE